METNIRERKIKSKIKVSILGVKIWNIKKLIYILKTKTIYKYKY